MSFNHYKIQFDEDDSGSVIDLSNPIIPTRRRKRKSDRQFKILRPIDEYKKGAIISENQLPLKYLFKIRSDLVILTKDKYGNLINFKVISNPSEWVGFFVSVVTKL